MISEYQQVYDCPECKTEFEKGDIVRCMLDPLYLTESRFDCGRHAEDIGIVVGVSFYEDRRTRAYIYNIVCELSIYWAVADVVTFHLDKYVQKIT